MKDFIWIFSALTVDSYHHSRPWMVWMRRDERSARTYLLGHMQPSYSRPNGNTSYVAMQLLSRGK